MSAATLQQGGGPVLTSQKSICAKRQATAWRLPGLFRQCKSRAQLEAWYYAPSRDFLCRIHMPLTHGEPWASSITVCFALTLVQLPIRTVSTASTSGDACFMEAAKP